MSEWLPKRKAKPGSLPLLCFPFAGGGTAVYHQWRISSKIEVLPIRLPGRESRFNEPAIEDFEELISGLVSDLSEVWSEPYALFGHSMGAMIAYEIACRTTKQGNAPQCIFVSACGAPAAKIRSKATAIYDLPDQAMIDALIERYEMKISGDERALMMILAKTLRADLKLFDSYEFQSNAKLTCPMFACGGSDDPRVTREKLEAWSAMTKGKFTSRVFAGGHFYVRNDPQPVSEFVEKKLLPLV